MIVTAVAVMVGATLAQHLGLSEAIAEVLTKIAKCSMCCSMWATFAALLWVGTDIVPSAVTAVIMAYLSNYVGLLLILLQKVYLWIREKTEKMNVR